MGDVGAQGPPDDEGVLGGAAGEPGLELILEEVESVVDPIAESAPTTA